jgi:hypothetical protein
MLLSNSTPKGDGDGQFCLTGGKFRRAFWKLVIRPIRSRQVIRYFRSGYCTDLRAIFPFLQYFTIELLENTLSK